MCYSYLQRKGSRPGEVESSKQVKNNLNINKSAKMWLMEFLVHFNIFQVRLLEPTTLWLILLSSWMTYGCRLRPPSITCLGDNFF